MKIPVSVGSLEELEEVLGFASERALGSWRQSIEIKDPQTKKTTDNRASPSFKTTHQVS